MDTDVVFPLAAGAVLIVLVLAGTVMVFLRPSDTTSNR